MKALKLLLIAALAFAGVLAFPASGQQDPNAVYMQVNKAPAQELPVKVSSFSVKPVVLLVEKNMKTILAADAPNRKEAEVAAELLMKTFVAELAKAGIKISQDAEAVAEIKMYYSNTIDGVYKLVAQTFVYVNGKPAVAVGIGQDGPFIKEPSVFVEKATGVMAGGVIKNVIVVEKVAQR